MRKFIYRGPFSKGLEAQIAMGVTFEGREPSEVTDTAAVNWLTGHPEYEDVTEPPEPEPDPVATYKKAPAKKAKKPRKKKA